MAVRIQMRRGTTTQWNSADPVLNEGEIGYNSTVGAFKVGNGLNPWSELDYYQTAASITPQEISAIAVSEKGAANGVAELDASQNVLTKTGVVFEGSVADAYETTLSVTNPTQDRTVTIADVSGTVITTGNLSDITSVGTLTGLVINGNLTVTGTTTTIDTQNLLVEDKNITIGDVATPTDNTADGGGITLKGTTDKTFNWVDATDSWTSSENINLASGKNYLKNGTDIKDVTETLTNKTISGTSNTITNVANTSLTNSSITINGSAVSLGGSVTIDALPSQSGQNGKYLTTNGTTASWAAISADIEGVLAGTGLSGGGTSGTVTLSIDSTVATTSGTQTLTNKSFSLTNNTLTGTLAEFNTALSGADFATLAGSETLTNKTLGSSTALGADLSAATFKITNLGTPTLAADAATKQYVDDVAQGLHIHASCVAATTSNINLSNALENGDILDGVTLVTGNRVLVKNQTTTADNGIYIVQASGAAVRATDFDTPAEIHGGDFVFVTGGTVNNDTGWVQTEIVTTVGTSPIIFQQFSGAGTYQAGTGLTLTGNVFSINTGTTVDINTAQTLTNKTISGSTNTLSNIGNSSLTNSTISGVSLGSNLNALTIGTGLSGTSYNGSSAVTIAIDSTVATTSGTQTLTNKTIALGSNTISGTIAQFNTALTDGDFATLAGSETLSNKTLTAPRFATAGEIDDANGNELIKFSATVASAVNEITITNAAASGTPTISATGDDTNISLNLVAKGSGTVQAGGVAVVTTTGTQTLTNKTLSSATLTGTLTAGGGNGTSGQVLASTGSGVQWSTPAAGAAFSEMLLVGC